MAGTAEDVDAIAPSSPPPIDERLFFAGEACSPDDLSAAHGAFLTGLAAADHA